MSDIPPPPGFVLDGDPATTQPTAQASVPPPPPGFEMDHPHPSDPGWRMTPHGMEIDINADSTHPAPASPQPEPTGNFGENLAAGFGSSFVKTGRGLKQAGTDAARYFVEQGFGIPAPGLRASLAEQQGVIDEQARLDAPLDHSGGGKVGGVLGQIAQMAVPIGAVAGRAGMAANAVRGAGQAAAFAATQPVESGDTRAGNMAEQGAFGAAGGAIAGGLSGIASKARDAIDPEMTALIKRAKDFNIPLHLSQLTNSKAAKVASSALNYLPFSGGSAAIKKQADSFTKAVGSTFDAPTANLSDTVMANVRKNFDVAYRNIFRGETIKLDQPAMQSLANLRAAAVRDLEADPAKVVLRQIDRIVDNSVSGQLTGKLYQSLRGELKKFADGTMKGEVVGAARKVLDDAAHRSIGPTKAAQLVKTNAKYANYKTAQDALKQVAGARGAITPASLWNLVRNGSTTEMRDLAKIGQVLLKDPIPDSGTAGRAAVYSSLGIGSVTAPAAIPILAKSALIGATAGRALNSQTAANLLTQGRPINAFARMARPAPVLLPAVAAASEKKNAPK